jgi:hypothetical protein
MIAPSTDVIVIVGSCSSDSSNDESSDPDDPISRAARRAAVRAAQMSVAHRPSHSSTIADYFRPMSSAAYLRQVAIAAQPDCLDLRSVVAVPAAVFVASEGDDDEVVSSVTSSNSPGRKRRYGYVIDGFVVDSESDGSQ